jgi:outer membrane murein-binding lipoprotein Lpp
MADQQNGGSKWFRLGPIEYAAVALVLAGAGAFFVKMNEKIDNLSTAVPRILDKQDQQGDDIDRLGDRVDRLSDELTNMRLREAEQRGREAKASAAKGP